MQIKASFSVTLQNPLSGNDTPKSTEIADSWNARSLQVNHTIAHSLLSPLTARPRNSQSVSGECRCCGVRADPSQPSNKPTQRTIKATWSLLLSQSFTIGGSPHFRPNRAAAVCESAPPPRLHKWSPMRALCHQGKHRNRRLELGACHFLRRARAVFKITLTATQSSSLLEFAVHLQKGEKGICV